MSTIRGKTSATPNSVEIRYSPQEGWSSNYGIEGPKGAVAPLIQQLADAGFSLVYRCDQSPKAALVYSTPGNVEPGGGTEVPTLLWEYFANLAEIDILEADITAVNAASEDDKRKIRVGIQSPSEDSAPSISGSEANSLYQLMLQGVRSFRVNIPTLRVSKLVSGSYPVKASLTNVGRIITTSTLNIQESIPGEILFNLPDFTSSKSGFVYAWYKHHPQVSQAGGYRWNVSQQWEYGLYPTLLYGSAL